MSRTPLWSNRPRRVEQPLDVNLLTADVGSVPRLADDQGVQQVPGQALQVGAQCRVVGQAVDPRLQPPSGLQEQPHQRAEVCFLVICALICVGDSLRDQFFDRQSVSRPVGCDHLPPSPGLMAILEH